MHVVFALQDKQRLEGIVLAVGWRRLRVVIPGHGDAIDLRCDQDGKWTTEYGEGLDFDSIIAENDVAEFFRAVFPNVLVARPREE